MIAGGVLERYANLRVVITELGVSFAPPLIGMMDAFADAWPEMRASRDIPGRVTKLTMKPSEYWAARCTPPIPPTRKGSSSSLRLRGRTEHDLRYRHRTQ